MRHGILGPGGVGGLIAAVLADAGESVELIVRRGTESLYPREISLESPLRNLHAPVSVTSCPESPLDVLWVTVKATQLLSALQAVSSDLQVKAVVPLLNGIDHVERLRERFGADRVIAATIAVESERVTPGKIVHRSPFARLSVSKDGQERLASVLPIFQRFGFECFIVNDEATLMWGKLVFLAPVALSTSAARSAIGEVLSDPVKTARLKASVHEVCAVATQEGAEVDADAVIARIRALPPGMRSSMERDIASGNAPELDAIAGPILRGAERRGIVTRAIAELVREIT